MPINAPPRVGNIPIDRAFAEVWRRLIKLESAESSVNRSYGGTGGRGGGTGGGGRSDGPIFTELEIVDPPADPPPYFRLYLPSPTISISYERVINVKFDETLHVVDTGLGVKRAIPEGGEVGEYLCRTADGYGWGVVTTDGGDPVTYTAGSGLQLVGTVFGIRLLQDSGLTLESTGVAVTRQIPAGGLGNQYLKREGDGYAWDYPDDTDTTYTASNPIRIDDNNQIFLRRPGTSGLSVGPDGLYITRQVPPDGNPNEYMKRTSTGYTWGTPPDTDTIYTQGTGIAISGSNVISCTITGVPDSPITQGDYYLGLTTDQTLEVMSWTKDYTAGTGISISTENVISATNTGGDPITYTAGTGITISAENVITCTIVDTNTEYTEGTGIDISDDNVISCTVVNTDTNTTYASSQSINIAGATNQLFLRRQEDSGIAVASTGVKVERQIPTGGSVGEYLERTADGYTWGTPPDTNTTYTQGTGINISTANVISSTIVGVPDSPLTEGFYFLGLSVGPSLEVLSWDKDYTAGTGISISSENVISATGGGGGTPVTYTAGTGISISGSNVISSTVVDTNTEYTEGTGISISDENEISCTVENTNTTYSHSNSISIVGDSNQLFLRRQTNSGIIVESTGVRVERQIPSGGEVGEYLKKVSNGYDWDTPDDTTYTAGAGIAISASNVISAIGSGGDPIAYTAGDGLTLTGTVFDVDLPVPSNGTTGQVLKRGTGDTIEWSADNNTTYSAGTGITISGTNVINCTVVDTNTEYTEGTGISISDQNVISCTVTDTDTVYTEGTGINISDQNVISSTIVNTDTIYTEGAGIDISSQNVISVEKEIPAYPTAVGYYNLQVEIFPGDDPNLLWWKELTAGSGININASSVISNTRPVSDHPTTDGTYYLEYDRDSGTGTQSWQEFPSVGETYTAGTGIAISSSNVISNTVPGITPHPTADGYYLLRYHLNSGTGTQSWQPELSFSDDFVWHETLRTVGLRDPVPDITLEEDTGRYYLEGDVNHELTSFSVGWQPSPEWLYWYPNTAVSNGDYFLKITWSNTEDNAVGFAPIYTAGAGIAISSSNVISSTVTPTVYTAGTGISISNSNVISSTVAANTYTAGTGLTLTGSRFDVDIPVPSGGDDQKVLGQESGNLAWVQHLGYGAGTGLTLIGTQFNVNRPVPSGGTEGHFLKRIANDEIAWRAETTYTAGTGIAISSSNVISSTVEAILYTAGTGINISSNNVISCTVVNTDTTYGAGDGLTLSGTTFNIDNPVPSTGQVNNRVLGIYNTNIAWIDQQDTTYTGGTGISISASNVISSTVIDTVYSAGHGIFISADNEISSTINGLPPYPVASGSYIPIATVGGSIVIEGWIRDYNAGTGISISSNNQISLSGVSVPAPSNTGTYFLKSVNGSVSWETS